MYGLSSHLNGGSVGAAKYKNKKTRNQVIIIKIIIESIFYTL